MDQQSYKVPSSALAEEILKRIVLARRAREALGLEARDQASKRRASRRRGMH